MSKKNGKNVLHRNTLIPSTMDEMGLCKAVDENFRSLAVMYQRQNGKELVPPPSLDSDMLRWRSLFARYKKGDMRHTESEYRSMKVVAQWTLDINCQLRGQPTQKIKWKDGD